MTNNDKLVANLNSTLETARKAYYAGTPIISDGEYDLLERQLAGLVKDGLKPSVLTTVGTHNRGRISHQSPMRSIENYYSIDKVIAWAKDVKQKYPEVAFTLGYKHDGISASLSYKDGKLVQALTRGDGESGEDITAQVQFAVPATIPDTQRSFEIRGELMVSSQVMDSLNEQSKIQDSNAKLYVSPRNLVAGTVKLKDLEEIRRRSITFFPWEVNGFFAGSSHADRLIQIHQKFGFNLTHNPGLSIEEIPAILAQLLEEKKDSIWGFDGFVLKVDQPLIRQELGIGNKFANYQICYKLQNSEAETILKDVEWQVGRQGRLTPVGILEPVVLNGAKIERVTLNNITWIEGMGLKKGSRVMVVRSGEVVPQIVDVIT